MDDLMPSLVSVEKAIETRRQLADMGDKAWFYVRKWVSNLTEVLGDVPEEDRVSEVDLNCPWRKRLPKKHHVTGQIVQYYHESEGHWMGVNYTISHPREN